LAKEEFSNEAIDASARNGVAISQLRTRICYFTPVLGGRAGASCGSGTGSSSFHGSPYSFSSRTTCVAMS
jgi:hypothetical protein